MNMINSKKIRARWRLQSKANRLAMQADGNLVLYADSTYIWDSQTAVSPPAASYTLSLQDDGNLVIDDSNGTTIWSAK